MEPMADDVSALPPFRGPVLEAEVRQLVGFDAERLHDNAAARFLSSQLIACLRTLVMFAPHASYRWRLPQSSSASRFTAGAFGFLTLIQCLERPDRYSRPTRFD